MIDWPTVDLVQLDGAKLLHHATSASLGAAATRCGRAGVETERHDDMDARTIRYRGTRVCSECRRLTEHDQQKETTMAKTTTKEKGRTTTRSRPASRAEAAPGAKLELDKLPLSQALRLAGKRIATTRFQLAHPEKYTKEGRYSKERIAELKARLQVEEADRDAVRAKIAEARKQDGGKAAGGGQGKAMPGPDAAENPKTTGGAGNGGKGKPETKTSRARREDAEAAAAILDGAKEPAPAA